MTSLVRAVKAVDKTALHGCAAGLCIFLHLYHILLTFQTEFLIKNQFSFSQVLESLFHHSNLTTIDDRDAFLHLYHFLFSFSNGILN